MASEESVAAVARRLDSDRFFPAAFAADPARGELWAVIALDATLGQVPLTQREPGLAAIRLQWWREALDRAASGRPVGEPVADAMGATMARHGLAAAAFDPLIAAREREVSGESPADLAELESHVDATAGTVQRIGLRILGVEGLAAREAATEVGLALGLVHMALAAPHYAAFGRAILPAALGGQEAIEDAGAVAGGRTAALRRRVAGLARAALGHLATARALSGQTERGALPLLLPAILLDARLGALHRAGHDPARMRAPGPGRILRLLWAASRGSF